MIETAIERTFIWKSLQIIARILTTLLFDLKVHGLENIPETGGALIVSNHQGYLDPVVLAVRMQRPLSYFAKSELFRPGWRTWLLHALNAFPVRQGAGDIGAVKETIHRLKEGHLLNIYPEGTRTPDGTIQPLQKGVALIVHRAGVPVIPAVIVGSFEAWPLYRKCFRPSPVWVQFGKPMELEGLKSNELVATIDGTLRRMFDDCNKCCGNETGQ